MPNASLRWRLERRWSQTYWLTESRDGYREVHDLTERPVGESRFEADEVFAAVPPGATRVTTMRHPAFYSEPEFTGGGWHGPSVVATFRTASPPRDVYRFYAQRAEAAGWKPTAAGAFGLTDRWAKTYADGAFATLVLSLLSRAPPEGVYSLSGGIAPVIG